MMKKMIAALRQSCPTLAITAVAFFALLASGASQRAQAQWSQPDPTTGNINSTNTGNVGIGTTSPGTRLETRNDQDAVVRLIGLNNASSGTSAQATLSFFEGTTEKAKLAVNGSGAASYIGGVNALQIWHFQNAPIVFGTNSAERVRIDGTGNVGIGTTSPNQTLTVNGYSSSGFGSTMQIIGPASYGAAQNQLNITSTANIWGLILGQNNSGVASSLYHCANCAHIVNFNNAALVFGTNNTDRMRIDGAGNVAIGPTGTLPGYKLDVQGGQINASGGLCIAGDCKTSWSQVGGGSGSSQWTTSGSTIYYNSGSIGIGTTSPAHKLTLAGGWVATDNGYGLAAKDASGTHRAVVYLDSSNNIRFGEPSFTTHVIFNNTGNVGIGQSNPSYKLDVNGTAHVTNDLTVDGNINAKYQDVAEWVPALHSLPAGTVVVLNPNQSNQVMASTEAYDTRVAGVVSARPGVALGEASTDKVLVATTGRVKVKVDATRAPIHVGDLLVTSDQEGVAMKSEPLMIQGRQFHAPGTLIGKALEPLEKGTGEILVLLSLQ